MPRRCPECNTVIDKVKRTGEFYCPTCKRRYFDEEHEEKKEKEAKIIYPIVLIGTILGILLLLTAIPIFMKTMEAPSRTVDDGGVIPAAFVVDGTQFSLGKSTARELFDTSSLNGEPSKLSGDVLNPNMTGLVYLWYDSEDKYSSDFKLTLRVKNDDSVPLSILDCPIYEVKAELAINFYDGLRIGNMRIPNFRFGNVALGDGTLDGLSIIYGEPNSVSEDFQTYDKNKYYVNQCTYKYDIDCNKYTVYLTGISSSSKKYGGTITEIEVILN